MQEFEEFQNVTQHLHHLVSTKNIPGVYKRLDNIESDKTIYDVPIEDHLRSNARVR
jgi:hypothetical protein